MALGLLSVVCVSIWCHSLIKAILLDYVAFAFWGWHRNPARVSPCCNQVTYSLTVVFFQYQYGASRETREVLLRCSPHQGNSKLWLMASPY
ncbi:hypothetical protein GGR57DRAFT_474726 [Xylariaceae sp. FL1272]|nr:hypothetical protein GGR57DRAFT_474726 [Xylariaceae sp. FL1272]